MLPTTRRHLADAAMFREKIQVRLNNMLPKKIDSELGYRLVAGVFFLSATIVELTTLDRRIWFFTAGPTIAVAMLLGVLAYRRDSAGKQYRDISKSIRRERLQNELSVKLVSSKSELMSLWRLDVDLYGQEDMISYELFLAWWNACPIGAHVLVDDGEIVGALGLWPLREAAFNELLGGQRPESRLSSRSFHSAKDAAHARYWYAAGVTLRPKYRKRIHLHALKILIEATFRDLFVTIAGQSSIDICALAYTQEGEALLSRFRFTEYRQASETVHKFPVYALLGVTPQDLRDRIEQRLA